MASRHPFPLGRGRFRAAGEIPLVMGILNVTPDSFSDGGRWDDVKSAVRRGRCLANDGASILDVGGESTRPGAEDVSLEEELRRVVPVVRALRERIGLPVSVDTKKSGVFREAYAAGADLLNDVSGLTADPEMIATLGATDAAVIVMHMRGTPSDMDRYQTYGDVVSEVVSELWARVESVRSGGVADDRIILDPGLGFAKDADANWEVLEDLDRFRAGKWPLLIGASRKRFLGAVTGRERPDDRDQATAALSALLYEQGVEAFRVHDARATADALRVAARYHGVHGGNVR